MAKAVPHSLKTKGPVGHPIGHPFLPSSAMSTGVPLNPPPITPARKGEVSDSCFRNIVELFAKRFACSSGGLRNAHPTSQIHQDLRQGPPRSRRCLRSRVDLLLQIHLKLPFSFTLLSNEMQHGHFARPFNHRSNHLVPQLARRSRPTNGTRLGRDDRCFATVRHELLCDDALQHGHRGLRCVSGHGLLVEGQCQARREAGPVEDALVPVRRDVSPDYFAFLISSIHDCFHISLSILLSTVILLSLYTASSYSSLPYVLSTLIYTS